MRVHICIGMILLATASALPQTVATGSMQSSCRSSIELSLTLLMPDNRTAQVDLFRVPDKHTLNSAIRGVARWCSSPKSCEDGKAIVVFKQFKMSKKASGSFTVEFPDGRKENGTFDVKTGMSVACTSV